MEYSRLPGIDYPVLGVRGITLKYKCSLRELSFYEDEGLLVPLRIDQQRFYSETDEITLQLILQGKRSGLSLEEIRDLIVAKSEDIAFEQVRNEAMALLASKEKIVDHIAFLTKRRNRIDAAIAELRKIQSIPSTEGSTR